MARARRSAFEQKLFAFGSYCARNQIKVLLYNCVFLFSIICIVNPIDHLPWRRPNFPTWWTTDPSIQVSSDPICLKAVPADYEWRVLQVKVVKDLGHDQGVLDRGLLHQMWQMEHAVQPLVTTGLADWNCLAVNGACLTSSPMEYWNHSESDLLSDRHLLHTLSKAPKTVNTGYGLPLPMEAAFTDKRAGPGFSVYSAKELVTAWFMQHPTTPRMMKELANKNIARDAWFDALSHATVELGQMQAPKGRTTQFILKQKNQDRDTDRSKEQSNTVFVVGYSLVALYIAWRLKKLDRVHSRSGLFLTALVSMVASGLLSLSVCKLLRFSVDSIPWRFLPLLFAVLATDNAMMLTEAVTATPIDLPIPERIGEGLASVGPSILWALLVEHILLLFATLLLPARSVREMTLLAAVTLKADAVMQVTLFLAILSIDIQRLELADLLRQGATGLHRQSNPRLKLYHLRPDTQGQLSTIAYQVFCGCMERLARSVCFVTVIACNLWLYAKHGKHYFVPAFCSQSNLASVQWIRSHAPPSKLWSALNPSSKAAVRVVLEAPVVFWPHVFGGMPTPTSFFGILFAFAFDLFKTVVFPVAAATGSIYLLLRYLLKDGDLLIAEKDRAVKEKEAKAKALEHHIGPRATGQVIQLPSQSDVEVLSISNNGTIASWSLLDECITLTHMAPKSRPFVKTVSLKEVNTAVRKLCISHDARVCALANAVGDVSIYSLVDGEQIEFPPEARLETPTRTVQALFADQTNGRGTPPKLARASDGRLVENERIFALYSDGSLVAWDCAQRSVCTLIPPLEAVSQSGSIVFAVLPSPTHYQNWPVIARVVGGAVQIWNYRVPSSWSISITIEAAVLPRSRVNAISYAPAMFQDTRRVLVAIGFEDGHVGIWDGESGELVLNLGREPLAIRKLRLSPCSRSRCPCASEILCDSVLVAYGTDARVTVKKCLLPADQRSCKCSKGTSRKSADLPRSSSFSSTKDFTSADSSQYPLSPHAIRRVTQSQDKRFSLKGPQSDAAHSTASDALPERPPSYNGLDATPTRPEDVNTQAAWAKELRLADFGAASADATGFWELLGSHMLAGLRKPLGDVDQLEGWELFFLDLSHTKRQTEHVTSCVFPDDSGGSDGVPNDSQGMRRRGSTRPFRASLLPFSRIRCWAATQDCQHVAVSYGSAVALLSPTVGSKGITPSNDALLAFLANTTGRGGA